MDTTERCAQRAGFAAIIGTLAVILWSVWRGIQRPVGQKTGQEPTILRTRTFYSLASVGYFGLCMRLWRPLPMNFSGMARAAAVFFGTLLLFPGLALVLWGRLALGAMHNVSSSFGAQLFADHRLVNEGPFAIVRHPMYLGILLVATGGLLLYRTWTFVFVLFHFPTLVIRARREEQVLEAEFGERWLAYRRRVPAGLPACMIGSAPTEGRSG